MGEFFRSYNEEVMEPYHKWLKNHIKGMIVFYAIFYALYFTVLFWSDIVDKFNELIDKHKAKKEAKKSKKFKKDYSTNVMVDWDDLKVNFK